MLFEKTKNATIKSIDNIDIHSVILTLINIPKKELDLKFKIKNTLWEVLEERLSPKNEKNKRIIRLTIRSWYKGSFYSAIRVFRTYTSVNSNNVKKMVREHILNHYIRLYGA